MRSVAPCLSGRTSASAASRSVSCPASLASSTASAARGSRSRATADSGLKCSARLQGTLSEGAIPDTGLRPAPHAHARPADTSAKPGSLALPSLGTAETCLGERASGSGSPSRAGTASELPAHGPRSAKRASRHGGCRLLHNRWLIAVRLSNLLALRPILLALRPPLLVLRKGRSNCQKNHCQTDRPFRTHDRTPLVFP